MRSCSVLGEWALLASSVKRICIACALSTISMPGPRNGRGLQGAMWLGLKRAKAAASLQARGFSLNVDGDVVLEKVLVLGLRGLELAILRASSSNSSSAFFCASMMSPTGKSLPRGL